MVRARRLEPDKNVRWEIHIRPDSNAAVTIVLPATTDCEAEGAICTGDGRKLSNALALTITVRASRTSEQMRLCRASGPMTKGVRAP